MRKQKQKKQEQKVEPTSSPDTLKEYIEEANLVERLTEQPGWKILERDIEEYMNRIIPQLAYLNTDSHDFHQARILFVACDKLIKLVEDYQENKNKAIELLNRLENTKESIILDVDNG